MENPSHTTLESRIDFLLNEFSIRLEQERNLLESINSIQECIVDRSSRQCLQDAIERISNGDQDITGILQTIQSIEVPLTPETQKIVAAIYNRFFYENSPSSSVDYFQLDIDCGSDRVFQ